MLALQYKINTSHNYEKFIKNQNKYNPKEYQLYLSYDKHNNL